MSEHKNVTPELITAEQVGRWFFQVSSFCVHKYKKQGKIPPPVECAGRQLWRYRELIDWIASGCPLADNWHWTPAKWQTLEERVQAKNRELANLQGRINEAKEELRQLAQQYEQTRT
jgi:hypothetical protein